MPVAKLLAALACAALFALPAQAQTRVTVALDWTPNTNHVGLYVAKALGYYDREGLSVDILPYSDTSAGTLIANGIADFGVSGTLGVYAQHSAGSDIRAVFAITQKETGRLIVNADRTDIHSPADLDGLTYGGFGTGWEDALLTTIIRNAGGKGDFEMVTLGTSAYQALASGRVDFTLDIATWEGVEAEIEGRAPKAFAYADYGVPDEHTTLLAASDKWLKANSDTAARFLAATRRGYAYAAAHPEDAAGMLIAANPAALTNENLVDASMRMLATGGYLARADGTVGRMDPAKMERMGAFMFEHGLLVDGNGDDLREAPDFREYYTNAYLDAAGAE